MKTRKHISAGTVIFRINKLAPKDEKREYLLLYYLNNYWDLPKGTIEEGETLQETAKREAKEETGLQVEIIDGFKEKISYFYKEIYTPKEFRDKKGSPKIPRLVFKKVIFFVAKALTEKVKISDEHSDHIWLPYKKALSILKYKTAKEILTKADSFLKEHSHSKNS